jgi:dipeptidyl aminopeptidase/acylaminoacyl peptidase
MRIRSWSVLTIILALPATLLAQSPRPAPPAERLPYTQLFYRNGALRLEAYLYKPAGDGPFPLIVYNHGTREGQDRLEQPFPFIGRLFTSAGFAVLVPERRGYGKSDGMTVREQVGPDTGDKMLDRLHKEATDVLAAVEYVKTEKTVDTSRIGIIGWSFGGIVSLFAAKQTAMFFAVVDQAGGALTWRRSPALQSALRAAARDIREPLLCMDAENDATTDAVKGVRRRAFARDFHGTENLSAVQARAKSSQRRAWPSPLLRTRRLGVGKRCRDLL